MDLKQIANDQKYVTAVAICIEERTFSGSIYDGRWEREDTEEIAREILRKIADLEG